MGQLMSRMFWPQPAAACPAQTPTVRTSPTTPVPHAPVSAEPAPSPEKHDRPADHQPPTAALPPRAADCQPEHGPAADNPSTHKQQGAPAADMPTPTTTTAVSSTAMAVQPTTTESATTAVMPPNEINNTAGSKPPCLHLGLMLASLAAVSPSPHVINTPANQNMSRVECRTPPQTDRPAISAAPLCSPPKCNTTRVSHMIGQIVIDLEGATITADKLTPGRTFCVTKPGMTYRNGTVMLPAGTSFTIKADNVKLQDLTIIKTTADISCLEIRGSKHVVVENCTIKFLLPTLLDGTSKTAAAPRNQVAPGFSTRTCCVVVTDGSRVSFHGCVISGAPRSGVRVYGNSTYVDVTDTYVLDNGYAGITVNKGAVLNVGDYCATIGNGHHGITVTDASVLKMGDGCRAVGNGAGIGFGALGRMSRLELGSGCTAVRNTTGYYAQDQAVMNVGAGCEAVASTEVGFGGRNGHLRLGPQCAAVRTVQKDKSAGVIAAQGGIVKVGDGFIATSSRGYAVVAQGQGSKLFVGPGIRAPTGGGQVRAFSTRRDGEVHHVPSTSDW